MGVGGGGFTAVDLYKAGVVKEMVFRKRGEHPQDGTGAFIQTDEWAPLHFRINVNIRDL